MTESASTDNGGNPSGIPPAGPGVVVAGGTIYGPVVGGNWGTINVTYHLTAPAPSTLVEERNRRAMIAKVATIWVDGLLKHSLYREVRIELGLHQLPQAVAPPLDLHIRQFAHEEQPLPAGTHIFEIFNRFGGALLILGAPGAGKTTLLLELAEALLVGAREHPTHPIPVVFNLASWAQARKPLAAWLVDELASRYDVPRKIGQPWVENEHILPLLDGLDEVALDQRDACVEAINAFRHEHGLLPIAVCSRSADYAALTVKLRLEGAIVAQPLTREHVRQYLRAVGLRIAPSSTSPLWELLDTPLMLNIATLTYAGHAGASLPTMGTADEQRDQLFTAYVERMFQRRPASQRFSKPRTLHWLAWLAWQLQRHSQTVLYLEHLQPDWLPSRAARLQYTLIDRGSGLLLGGLPAGLISGVVFGLLGGQRTGIVMGLLVGLLCALFGGIFGGQRAPRAPRPEHIRPMMYDALLGWLVVGVGTALFFGVLGVRPATLATGLGAAVLSGLIFGLLGGLHGAVVGAPSLRPRHIAVVETLQWSSPHAKQRTLTGCAVGVTAGLAAGLLLGIAQGLGGQVPQGWVDRPLPRSVMVVGIGLMAGFVLGPPFGLLGGLLFGLLGGLTSGEIEQKTRPNQGIRRSARQALLSGLGVGLVFGLGVGLVCGLPGLALLGRWTGLGVGLGVGLLGALLVGLLVALANGGYACLSHAALRLVLSHNGVLPLAAVRFLDENTGRILLRNVGGGYIFVHRMLLDWFAKQYQQESSGAKQPGGR